MVELGGAYPVGSWGDVAESVTSWGVVSGEDGPRGGIAEFAGASGSLDLTAAAGVGDE